MHISCDSDWVLGRRCVVPLMSLLHIHSAEAAPIWIHKMRNRRVLYVVEKWAPEQAWALKFHEKASGLNHIAGILDQTSKRSKKLNNRNVSKSTSSSHKRNHFGEGSFWGTGNHGLPLRVFQQAHCVLSQTTAESVIWTWCTSTALCCQHCSVMRSGANFLQSIQNMSVCTDRFGRLKPVCVCVCQLCK